MTDNEEMKEPEEEVKSVETEVNSEVMTEEQQLDSKESKREDSEEQAEHLKKLRLGEQPKYNQGTDKGVDTPEFETDLSNEIASDPKKAEARNNLKNMFKDLNIASVFCDIEKGRVLGIKSDGSIVRIDNEAYKASIYANLEIVAPNQVSYVDKGGENIEGKTSLDTVEEQKLDNASDKISKNETKPKENQEENKAKSKPTRSRGPMGMLSLEDGLCVGVGDISDEEWSMLGSRPLPKEHPLVKMAKQLADRTAKEVKEFSNEAVKQFANSGHGHTGP